MAKIRRRYSNEFKAQVALEAIVGIKTASEIAAENNIHVKIVSQWKGELTNNASHLFEKNTKSSEVTESQKEEILNPVYKEVGKLQVENEWLKKKLRPYL
jgi:putative transposase